MKTLPLLTALLAALPAALHAADGPPPTMNEVAWKQLNLDLTARQTQLISLISKGKGQGIATDYAAVSAQVIASFQLAARHDREHVDDVRRNFGTFRWKRTVDTDAAAERLAADELRDCLQVADHAITELRQQLDGEISLSGPPDLSKGNVTLGKGAYYLDGRPIFPSSMVWLPHDEMMMNAFGRLGGGFFQLTGLREDGTIVPGGLKGNIASAVRQVELNAAPMVYFFGHAAAPWMKAAHPEILEGARHFTQYDIDSPLVRTWIKNLCAGTMPTVMQATGNQPTMQLLANEPHFATAKGGWLANHGVSAFTMEKYRAWIARKYQTVEALNHCHGTSYRQLAEVMVAMPIDPALRGGPVWYDWCRFNMDRVNDWFAFLKETAQASDPKHSPVTIKTLGHILGDPSRDHGMDIEYLTRLQDVPGSDLRVVPQGATFYGKNEDGRDTEGGWEQRYAYLWIDQSMMLDFTKSLCPDKVFYDSEWHGFSTVSWRHDHMNRDYVRSALWLAFSHGMGAINPWLWGRGLDGSLRQGAEYIGELSTQPIAVDAYGRVMKELNAHAEQVLAGVPRQRAFLMYYCEESAIQSGTYMEQMRDVYEALKLLNLTVGFVTPTDLGGLDAKTQTLIVSPTSFISEANLRGLRSFQTTGGRIVLVGAEQSFAKTEHGVTRADRTIKGAFASLPIKDAPEMVPVLDRALAGIKPELPMNISITDQADQRAFGVLVSESMDAQTGAVTLVLNNVSKDPLTVTLRPRRGQSGKFTDTLTRKPAQASFRMGPCDVRVLTNSDMSPRLKSDANNMDTNRDRLKGLSVHKPPSALMQELEVSDAEVNAKLTTPASAGNGNEMP